MALIEGGAGCGKTRLLWSLVERLSDRDVLVLHATSVETERGVPMSLIEQLLHSAVLPGGAAARVADLLDRAARTPPPCGDVVEPESARLFTEVFLVIRDLSRERPVLLAVDDAHNADQASLLCLLHLVRRLRGARVLTLLAVNAGGGPAAGVLTLELAKQADVTVFQVRPLTVDEVADLLARELEPADARGNAAAFHAATGGNPRLLRAVVDDHLAGTADIAYGAALSALLSRLDQSTGDVVRAVAVLGDPVSQADIEKLVPVDATAVQRALDTLCAVGVLHGLGFRHQGAARAVLDATPPAERADLHETAARLCHEQGAVPATVADHLLLADRAPAPWGIEALVEAATGAAASGDTVRAEQCLALAHRGCTDPRRRAEVLARLAHVRWITNPAAATHDLTVLAEAAEQDVLTATHVATLLRQLLWQGRTEEAQAVLAVLRAPHRAARPGAAPEPAAPADTGAGVTALWADTADDVERWLAFTHPPMAGQGSGHVVVSDRPAPSAAPAIDPWLHVAGALSVRVVRGRPAEVVGYARQVLHDLTATGDTSWAHETAPLALLALVCADQLDDAATWCDRFADGAARRSPLWGAAIRAVRADIAVRQGALAAACEHGEAALALVSANAWGVAAGYPLGSLVLAKSLMGEYAEAARLLATTLPDAVFRSRYGLHLLQARGYHYLVTNHPKAALADFTSCGELMRAWGIDNAGLAPWRVGAGEAWLRLGNQDRARDLAYDQMSRLGDSDRVRSMSLRLLGATSTAARRVRLLTEAADLAERCGTRLDQARALGDLSRTYQELNDKRRARALLRRALHLGRMCGAKQLTLELMAMSDGLGAARHAGGSNPNQDTLTAAERRVAALAAIGYTNREIAARLYVTASTVEQHLTRIYRKLDVQSRQDLPVEVCADLSRMG